MRNSRRAGRQRRRSRLLSFRREAPADPRNLSPRRPNPVSPKRPGRGPTTSLATRPSWAATRYARNSAIPTLNHFSASMTVAYRDSPISVATSSKGPVLKLKMPMPNALACLPQTPFAEEQIARFLNASRKLVISISRGPTNHGFLTVPRFGSP